MRQNRQRRQVVAKIIAMVLLCQGLSMLTGSAHQVEGANLQLVAELGESEMEDQAGEPLLVYEISAETSLVPPLESVSFGDPLPTMEDCRDAIETFFREQCPVAIDGIVVAPILDDVQFEAMENQVNLGEVSNFVMTYFILHYPLKSMPQTIDMKWNLFLPDRVKELVPQEPDPTGHDPQTVDAVFYTNGELDLIKFTPKEPQFIWHTAKPILSVEAAKRLAAAQIVVPELVLRLAWPIASVLLFIGLALFFGQGKRLLLWQGAILTCGLAGVLASHESLKLSLGTDVPDLSPTEAVQRFQDLHRNIYRAFDYDSDDEIYDTLAQSVTGALLDEIYSEVYKSLVVKDEGGAVCRVRQVNYQACALSKEPIEGEGYAIDCHWQVSGLVSHWEHTHERLNGYEARYEMRPEAGVWRISAVKVSREQHLSPEEAAPTPSEVN